MAMFSYYRQPPEDGPVTRTHWAARAYARTQTIADPLIGLAIVCGVMLAIYGIGAGCNAACVTLFASPYLIDVHPIVVWLCGLLWSIIIPFSLVSAYALAAAVFAHLGAFGRVAVRTARGLPPPEPAPKPTRRTGRRPYGK